MVTSRNEKKITGDQRTREEKEMKTSRWLQERARG
jgi:hypothetical protein